MRCFDIGIIRRTVTRDMIGAEVLVPTSPFELSQVPRGFVLNAAISEIPEKYERSRKQLGLYWAGNHFIAENTEDEDWNHPDKVDEQIKIKTGHIKLYVYYENPRTGEKTLHLKTKSISFANLAHLAACGFFGRAIPLQARLMGMSEDEFLEAVKAAMHSGGARG